MDYPEYYEYQPLQGREIRLLRIHQPDPCDGHPDEVHAELHVDIEVHNLGTLDFDALSYTWGPSTEEEAEEAKTQIFTRVVRCYPILCDGRIIRVNKSLRSALRRLRELESSRAIRYHFKHNTYRSRRKASRTWADGVCIDQENTLERGHQVSLMASIYRSANLVFSFLGHGDSQTRTALELLQTIGRIGEKNQALTDDASNFKIPSADVMLKYYHGSLHTRYNLFEYSGYPLPTAEQWWAWALFFSRPYFWRLWILQEVILAGRDRTYVLYGDYVLPIDMILFNISIFFKQQWNHQVLSMFNERRDLRDGRIDQSRFRRVALWMGRHHPYSNVMRTWQNGNTWSCFSIYSYQLDYMGFSEPRDTIYATLGFGSEWQSLDQQLLPIDYSISVSELFCRAMKYIILKSKNLDCLSLVSGSELSRSRAQLPSWCPNFAQEHGIYSQLFDRRDVNGGWKAAANSSTPVPSFQSPLPVLRLRGVFCDYIRTSTNLQSNDRRSTEWSRAMISFLSRTIVHVGNRMAYVTDHESYEQGIDYS